MDLYIIKLIAFCYNIIIVLYRIQKIVWKQDLLLKNVALCACTSYRHWKVDYISLLKRCNLKVPIYIATLAQHRQFMKVVNQLVFPSEFELLWLHAVSLRYYI